MPEELFEETWTILPPAFLPAAGILLIAAGVSLLLWSDLLVDLIAALLGVLSVLLGIGFLAGWFLSGRAGLLSRLLFTAGILSILSGILTLLWRDLVLSLILYLGAALALLLGLLLLLGGLLSLRGWARLGFLLGGALLLVTGVALALFPGPVARLLLAGAGAVIALAGGILLLLAASRRMGIPHPP